MQKKKLQRWEWSASCTSYTLSITLASENLVETLDKDKGMVDFPRNRPVELDIEQVSCSLKNLSALLQFLWLNPQSLNGYGK